MMVDHVVQLSNDQLINLKNLYSPDGTKSYIAYTTIDNYIRWFQQDPKVKHIRILCLNGDFSDGTFVAIDRCIAYADTFNSCHDRLLRLLKLLDYQKGYFFVSVRSVLRSVVKEAISTCSEIVNDETTLLYTLPKAEALNFDVDLPVEVDLKRITEQTYLEKVSSLWMFPNQTKLEYIKRTAKFNPQIGAFTKDGTLVSWIFSAPTGLLAILQIDENYLGNGFATLVAKVVCKKIAELGHDINAGFSRQIFPLGNFLANWVSK